jgi:hypothetical protein
MKIQGIEGLGFDQIQQEVARGGKFVTYSYCFSVVVMTFRRSTGIYFIRSGENAAAKGMQWTLISLFAGWWGFPWGLIYTPMALIQNFKGGKDVTREVMGQMMQSAATPPPPPGSWPPPPTAYPSN